MIFEELCSNNYFITGGRFVIFLLAAFLIVFILARFIQYITHKSLRELLEDIIAFAIATVIVIAFFASVCFLLYWLACGIGWLVTIIFCR